MEYYSTIKKNETMPFAAAWMNLEIIILSEVNEKEEDKYHMISLIYGTQDTTEMNVEISFVVSKGEFGREGVGVWD